MTVDYSSEIQRSWRDGCRSALGNDAESGNPDFEAGRDRGCQNGSGVTEMLMVRKSRREGVYLRKCNRGRTGYIAEVQA